MKYILENIEGAVKNEKSRETGNILQDDRQMKVIMQCIGVNLDCVNLMLSMKMKKNGYKKINVREYRITNIPNIPISIYMYIFGLTHPSRL